MTTQVSCPTSRLFTIFSCRGRKSVYPQYRLRGVSRSAVEDIDASIKCAEDEPGREEARSRWINSRIGTIRHGKELCRKFLRISFCWIHSREGDPDQGDDQQAKNAALGPD